MAIKINTTITTKSGISIPSGSVVSYDLSFPSREKIASFDLKVYLSQADLDNGKPALRDRIEEFKKTYNVDMLKSELAGVNNPLPVLEGKLKDFIEVGTGVGTCEIIDTIPED